MAIEMTDKIIELLWDWQTIGAPGGEEMPEELRAYLDAKQAEEEAEARRAWEAYKAERDAYRARLAYREEAVSGAIGADGYCYSDADPGM